MSEYSFEGRVAVVTGAGRGIGQAYARLLADRGASVVVNDLGGSMEGVGADSEPAQTAAAEIVAAGGVAIANTDDVATAAGGQAMIDAALEHFGRVDIVVNNAGIIWWGGPAEAGLDNLERHLAVHVAGSFNTTRAAWPHMVEHGYGRIVMTTSTGIFGLPENLSYATAKAAVIGMCRSLALEGTALGIKINVIAPNAHTRMGTDPRTDEPLSFGASGDTSAFSPAAMAEAMPPALVAPVVAFLAHEACPVSGEVYVAGGGRAARMFIALTPGYSAPGADLTIEGVANNWPTINDEAGYYVPADTISCSRTFFGT